ncbi:MAG: hypothetical protein K0R27_332 [Xanthobacteraceae bacterium]|jgi:hypothetical protein|nr:hypothetical protein [Xanthobacteraceae bacterium]
MRLVDNWQAVLKRAWSVRLIAAAALLSGIEVVLPFLNGALPIPPGAFAALSFFITAGALAARLIAQSNIGDKS